MLLYDGNPMLKIGPLPEVVPFAVEWGSTAFPHREWLDWMQKHQLGYGRVYPESGYPWVPYNADKRLIPFEIVRWEEGRPIVDLTRFNDDYWQNFARVIRECAERGIILQMQLYQRVFFQTRDNAATWETNYFHPRNNVNKFPIPRGRNGYVLWNEMVEHPDWRKMHFLWVRHILDAIGDKGNVIIDLMNEGAFKNQVSKAWIEYTLDIIEDWETRTDNDLLVGMDIDHFYKKNDPGLEYVLSHPRMELIICEGSEGHVVKDLTAGERKPIKEALAAVYRTQYRKPVISTNSPGYSVHENPDALRLYQWCSMMTKVQGVGVYAKTYPIDFDDENVKKYARQSQILMEFFESLKDYVALKPEAVLITQGPGKYRLTMASEKEIVVYLHTGEYGKTIVADEKLVLNHVPMRASDVFVVLLHPVTGRKEYKTSAIHNGRLSIAVNGFYEDLVIHVLPYNSADRYLREQALMTMRKAAMFFHTNVASHSGYVYYYSVDLKRRWGEGVATRDQIWVQPPGTPTVGMAYLKAFEATGDRFYLNAARQGAEALVYGQLQSGGWTNSIDFNPSGRVALYRNGKGRGKNNSSLDDGQTQSAIQLLVRVDKALAFQHKEIHESAYIALDALLAAQFPNGGFPQVWTGPVAKQPVIKASYPNDDWRTVGRIKNYWDMYTLNDNVAGYVARALIDAYRIYDDQRYKTALERLGDFLILAQMPDPQSAWAQQYNYDMKPIWARKFEPPAISSDESQEVIETLMEIYRVTEDNKYLEPIPRALAYLRRSLLPDGKLARFYELETNKPLYMFRRGDVYTLTYDDSNLPSHYGWKIDSRLDEIEEEYEELQRHVSHKRARQSLIDIESHVRQIVVDLDDQGRWISTYQGERLVGQPKFKLDYPYIASGVFSRNIEILSEYLIAMQSK